MTDLRHCHGTVALVISKLGLLVGCDSKRWVLQVGVSQADSMSKDLLKSMVDVGHALAVAAVLLLYTLEGKAAKSKMSKIYQYSLTSVGKGEKKKKKKPPVVVHVMLHHS